MQPDPKTRLPDRARHEVVRDRLRSLRLILGLILLLGLASMIGASKTATPAVVRTHIALWFLAQCSIIVGAVYLLRLVRRLRFGALPSSCLHRTSDGLVYIAAAVGGALALLAFAPRALAGAATGVDWLVVVIGLV
ncbi:MAG TPA: hypothetical protein VGB85_18070, partial [Nannocystis sp.]